MKNSYFRFKRFTIYQDACAMKVGTDGAVLGGWCSGRPADRILDVGTGTGIIALMLAQRTDARIDAVEIDPAAARQAAENAAASPWSERIHVYAENFIAYYSRCSVRYDRIVSNPPYFDHALLPPAHQRTLARHTTHLSFPVLFAGSRRLLQPTGTLSLIFPVSREIQTENEAAACGFHLRRKTFLSGRKGLPPGRILAEWTLHPTASCPAETLFIEEENRSYTPEFISVMHEFYLKM